MRSERPDLTARISGEAPLHKFTCTNDVNALSALLRNFYAPSARDREALSVRPRDARRDNRRSSRSPISHPATTRGKTPKSERNVSHGETKRFAFSS
jgi:hypothetical protein